MATLPDVLIPSTEWVDAYDITGIAPGSALLVQNKGSNGLIIWEGTTAPTTKDGVVVPEGGAYMARIKAGAPGVWLRAQDLETLVNVQEAS